MMNLYEVVIVLNTSNDIEKMIENTQKTLEKNGALNIKIERWGKKRFAYEINRKQFGDYTSFNFEAEPSVISEIEHEFRITEALVRFLIYRVSKAQLKQAELDKKKVNQITE